MAPALDADRVFARGVGGSETLPQEPGESFRRYRYRLPRVEFYLVEESR